MDTKSNHIGFTCKCCSCKFICATCDDEKGVKFKHRTHCYSGQLMIDTSGKEYHYCDHCWSAIHQTNNAEECSCCGISNCNCGSGY